MHKVIIHKYLFRFFKNWHCSSGQPLYYLTILIIIAAVIINACLYKQDRNFEYHKNKLYFQNQLDSIRRLIENDLNSILENKNPEHLILIKNFDNSANTSTKIYENGITAIVYVNDSKVILADFSNLFELLEEINRDNFAYYIELNNKIINNSIPKENYEIVFNGSIVNNSFSVKLKLLEHSVLKIESKNRIIEMVWYRIIISTTLSGFLYYVFLRYYQNNLRIRILENNINSITEFYKKEKDRIVSYYEYTKKDPELIARLDTAGLIYDIKTRNYFPLFLSQQVDEQKVHSFNLRQLDLLDLVDGYNIIYHTETELQINDQTLNGQINSFLENEVLKQILESIVINFLQLKSNSKEKGIIKITYFTNSFMFECNLIKLNKEHLIKWSRNIFNNTGNPFILDFYQIFKLLEIFYSTIKIDHNNDYLILNVKFELDSIELKHNRSYDNVIDITKKYKKK